MAHNANKEHTIGSLARAAGVGIDTVRYYERRSLLTPAARRASGYRVFGAAELQRLHFIRRAQQLGFSLDEVGELLRLVDNNGDRTDVRALATSRLADIEARLQDMQRLRDQLAGLVDACKGDGPLAHCPIIEAVVAASTNADHQKNGGATHDE